MHTPLQKIGSKSASGWLGDAISWAADRLPDSGKPILPRDMGYTWGLNAGRPEDVDKPLTTDLDPTYAESPLKKFMFDSGRAPGHATGLLPQLAYGPLWKTKAFGAPAALAAVGPAIGASVDRLLGRPGSWKENFLSYRPELGAQAAGDPYSERFEKAWDRHFGRAQDAGWIGNTARAFASGFGPMLTGAKDQLSRMYLGR